nr:ATP-binding protein [Saprospiraceae bacterium]
MNVNVDVYTNGILKKETVGYNNSIDANIIAGIIPKMKDQSGGEPCKYLLSKLYEIVRYDLCEIWSFKSETTNIGDVKKAVYPEKRKFPVKFKNLSHLKATTVPTISNNIKYRLVKQRSSLNSSKRGISAPAKIDRITCTSPKKDTSAISFPINVGKSLGIVIFYKYGIFECAVLSKLLPYIQFIKNIFEGAEQTENISGGSIRRTQENDEIKDTFLASVSHELRTPLNGIVGMISMLRDAGPLTDKQNEYLVILMECSHQLMTMLNNMLDFNKMVSKRLALLRISFDIHQCAEDAILMATGKAKNKGLEIKLEISKDIPRHLIGDPQRFIQILTNLLSNSIKFTEKGHILLKINGELEGLPEEYVKKWKISVEVHDTGVGIPQEDQEKIFNGFYQSQTLTKDMAQGGTGLGLSISRELIKLMNGNISVSSNPGQGTVFSFYIYSEEEIRIDSLESPETLKILKGSKVMIVDDRAEYRLQITEILFKLDCIPTAVSSGEEVLQYIKYGSNYDTIIVDICMPYMSGVELAQNLIQYEKQIGSNHTPLLALSSVELQG